MAESGGRFRVQSVMTESVGNVSTRSDDLTKSQVLAQPNGSIGIADSDKTSFSFVLWAVRILNENMLLLLLHPIILQLHSANAPIRARTGPDQFVELE
ncbi:unnamed protein product [Caenorhabditis bovis]|uniref:Uncharacterized protein n=1 Tax=Caenorhabditis bovis TaxID=2654633 RepID=A0A8S1FAY8_9PELO|nr:unnamed protein product [Caenorhabditis bovis]